MLLLAGCGGEEPATRLHWFIPDGFRADPEVFDVFRWAEEGRLPNLQRLMEQGAHGYSIPAFPSHTPANFATLLTGATPRGSGVADGPMHVEGHPLARPSLGGFSSSARKLPAAWSFFEDAGKRVFLLSMPGSTPPELGPGGITVRGRWGGWGPELPAVLFERRSSERERAMGRSARLFGLGEDLTRFVEPTPASWAPSALPGLEVDLGSQGVPLYGLLVDPPDDGKEGYARLLLSRDRQTRLADLGPGEWSDWLAADLSWQGVELPTSQRVEVIRLGADGFFRIRLLFDGLSRLGTDPPEVADTLRAEVGPMVDYVDSFPAQLVYYPEDKAAWLAEARQSLDWHRDAVPVIYRRYSPDVFLHNIYTPNQMLTSRWWLGHLDPRSRRHGEVGEAERAALWEEVLAMYRGIDEALGRAMDSAPPGTLVVFSSDHGVVPLDRVVRLNQLFAERGWLTVVNDPATGAPTVDWEHSKVVFLNAYHIYVHPEGLGGDWRRASGPAYDALRAEVQLALTSLRDGEAAPVQRVTRWEEAEAELRLPASRVGDLLLTAQPGYGWTESLGGEGLIGDPEVSGYKQGLSPDNPGLWTPFVLAGPGIKAGHRIAEPLHHVDQLPTLLRAMGQPIPAQVEGRVIEEVFE